MLIVENNTLQIQQVTHVIPALLLVDIILHLLIQIVVSHALKINISYLNQTKMDF